MSLVLVSSSPETNCERWLCQGTPSACRGCQCYILSRRGAWSARILDLEDRLSWDDAINLARESA